MAITPETYGIGKLIAKKDSGFTNETSFTSSVGKLKLIKSGLYSKVEVETTGGTGSGKVVKGVIGIDFSAVRASDITTYMTGKTWTQVENGAEISNGLSYYLLKHSNGKVGILKLNRNNSTTKAGTISAVKVVFASTTTTAAGTVNSYVDTAYDADANYQDSGLFPYCYNGSGNGWDFFNVGGTQELYDGKSVYIVQTPGSYLIKIQYLIPTGGSGITGYKVQ